MVNTKSTTNQQPSKIGKRHMGALTPQKRKEITGFQSSKRTSNESKVKKGCNSTTLATGLKMNTNLYCASNQATEKRSNNKVPSKIKTKPNTQ